MLASISIADLTPVFGQAESPNTIFAQNSESVIFIRVNSKRIDQSEKKAEGTGFIVSESGYIITNNHLFDVVSPGDLSTEVLGVAGSRYRPMEPLDVIHRDPQLDLALLRFKDVGRKRRPVVVGDASSITPGSTVYALGYPLGYDIALAIGSVSSLSAAAGNWSSNLPVNPGNSGGPVFDAKGRVVAVVRADQPLATGIAFVIPINFARNLLSMVPNLASGIAESGASPGSGRVQEPMFKVSAWWSGQTAVTQKSPKTGVSESPAINFGCEEKVPGSVQYTIPEERPTDIIPQAEWFEVSNATAFDAKTLSMGRTISAFGQIQGLARNMFNCPGGGHGRLRLRVSYQVDETIAFQVTDKELSLSDKLTTADAITFPLPSTRDDRVTSIKMLIKDNRIEMDIDSAVVQDPDLSDADFTASTINKKFQVSVQRNNVTITRTIE